MELNFQELLTLTDQVIDELELETGKCHAFAVALGEASNQDYDIAICIRDVFDKQKEYLGSTFSHAVAVLNENEYDCQGSNAIEAWEARWDPSIFKDEDGETSTFTWHTKKGSPDLKQVIQFIQSINVRNSIKLQCQSNFSYKGFKERLLEQLNYPKKLKI